MQFLKKTIKIESLKKLKKKNCVAQQKENVQNLVMLKLCSDIAKVKLSCFYKDLFHKPVHLGLCCFS